MKNPPVPQPEQNREWTRIDANNRALSRRGFCSRSFAFIRGSIRFSCGLAAAAFLPFAALAADSPSVLLQKGIYAEETEGNVDAAIKIYEQIAAESATNRAIVAQAQYRLAVCYQKKGNKEQAIKLLEELVQQFPSDANVSKRTKTTLTQLGVVPATAISVHRVQLNFSPGWIWDQSRDGRFISYESMMPAEDILVAELATGKSWTVFHGIKGKETPSSDALFSPDGHQIAFDIGDDDGGAAIYVANVDGSDRRKIYACDPAKEWLYLMAWSPDGTRLFAECFAHDGRKTKIRSIIALDAKSGARSEYATPPAQEERDYWQLSPDARYLARRKGEFSRKITVVDLASGREETVADQGVHSLIGWTPTGGKLVFSKSKSEGVDIWAIAIKDGKPEGSAKQIWSNFGSAGSTWIGHDENIYYATRKQKSDAFELWMMEGVLNETALIATGPIALQPEEILGPDHTILDRTLGVKLKIPAGWDIRSAEVRPNTGGRVRFVSLRVPESGSVATITYYPADPWEPVGPDYPLMNTGPKPVTPDEIDAWMRRWAEHRDDGLAKRDGQTRTFSRRPEGYVTRSVNGHRALSWSNDARLKSGETEVEFLTMSLTDKVFALVWLRCPSAEAETLRATYEDMVASLRLP